MKARRSLHDHDFPFLQQRSAERLFSKYNVQSDLSYVGLNNPLNSRTHMIELNSMEVQENSYSHYKPGI